MGYEAQKDLILKEKLIHNGEYKVSLVQYNKGEKKIAITKEMFLKDNTQVYTNKVGRIDLETAKLISNAIIELLK